MALTYSQKNPPEKDTDTEKAGAMRQAHWLRDDMLEMEHLESDMQPLCLG
jgi:hypothetical protein